jgi:hypothetical protein
MVHTQIKDLQLHTAALYATENTPANEKLVAALTIFCRNFRRLHWFVVEFSSDERGCLYQIGLR